MSDDDPHQRAGTQIIPHSPSQENRDKGNAISWFKGLIKGKATNNNSLREALEEYIEELEDIDTAEAAENRKILISNVLKTHEMSVDDVMVPRVDIVAIDADISQEELKKIYVDSPHSRIPVYRDNLDNVIGLLHIKDVLSCLITDCKLSVADMVRDVTIVSPSMPVMDLLHMMQEGRRHMALVMDEHGGIDGLVTINDVIQAIVGDIEDEFDKEEQPMIVEKADGTVVIDGRLEIEEFEEKYGEILSEDEREDIQTFGGLAFSLAGRVPIRGEKFVHPSGMVLEILDADTRRVKRLKLHTIPDKNSNDEV